MCNTVLEWTPDFRAILNSAGEVVVDGNGSNPVDYEGEFDLVTSTCLTCLRRPVHEAELNCVSSGYSAEEMGILLECPYPPGVELPLDEDRHPMNGLPFYLLWSNNNVAVSFIVRCNADGVIASDLRDRVTKFLGVQDVDILDLSSKRYRDWVDVKLKFPQDMLVGEVASVCIQVDVLLRRVGWNLGPIDTFLCVISGQVDRFLGVRESATLDAKESYYPLMTDQQKVEFAADLASFANSEEGGVILVGIATTKDGFGSDIISEIKGCQPALGLIDRYYSVVQNLVVPHIRNLRIETGEADGKIVVVILVPPQRMAIKPFLVRRGIVESGKVSQAAFSLPVRTGDRKRYISVESIQEMLSAGCDAGPF